jgi:putative oxidoreductase
MNIWTRLIAAVGRICISLIFLIMGAANIYNWQVAEVDVARVVVAWQGYTGYAIGLVPVLMGIGVSLQLIGGSLLFLGFQVRLGAALLLLYLIPVTIIYYPFWFLSGHEQSLALVIFLKNLAVVGGLIVIVGLGKGSQKPASDPNGN